MDHVGNTLELRGVRFRSVDVRAMSGRDGSTDVTNKTAVVPLVDRPEPIRVAGTMNPDGNTVVIDVDVVVDHCSVLV